MMKLMYSFVFIFFICVSCSNKSEQITTLQTQNDSISQVSNTVDSAQESSCCQLITEEHYGTLKSKFSKNDTLFKIVDFEEARKKLEGVVHWVAISDNDDSMIFPHKINFRNGGEVILFNKDDGFAEYYFTAYYPTEDILLLEGGHASEEAYDLTTGDDISVVGNPDMTYTSLDKTKRIMSYYSGQHSIYVYQERKGSHYVNRFDFRDYLKNCLGFDIDYIVEGFWGDDNVFYFFIPYYNDEGKFLSYRYYKTRVD